ncbi:MAG: MFS transporter [Desulfobacterales bacterium]
MEKTDREKAAYRWPMLTYLFLTNLIMNGVVIMVMPPLFPRIAGDLGLNYAQIGSIWGAVPLGMLLFSLIGGVVADRFGVKRVVTIALICAVVFAGLRGLASHFWTLWFFMFSLGVSYGFIVPNLTKGVAMWFGPEELSRANGILLMGASIGMGLGMILGIPLVQAFGTWRNVMFLTSGVSLALWVLWIVAARERKYTGVMAQLMKTRPGPVEGLKRVFTVKEMWLLCFAELFLIGGILAVVGLIPTYLVEKGMTESEAGIFTSLATWTSIIGMFVGPYLSDKFGLRKLFAWPFFLMNGIFTVALPLLWGWPLYLIWCLTGFNNGCALPQLRSIIVELREIGPILAGSAFGGIFTFNRIGGFTMPWLMGSVMTVTAVPASGFYVIGGGIFIPVILITFVRETGHRAAVPEAESPKSGEPSDRAASGS